MKVTAKVFDKQGNELYFKDLKDLLHYKDPVYNKDGDELCFNEEGTAEVLSKGFIDIPRVAHVSFCPYCYACKNVFLMNKSSNINAEYMVIYQGTYCLITTSHADIFK